ncbi:type II toxin-antitoxin system PemK/MazF family toxin [Wenjunlia tyrosinilytica]|jgi:mRNA-degrading endonuclease toxin of MazEF toxin-antitoxin module|uniref:Type II toxin-antitoxin system PemK/MazF family toxin n=1 Tax=Wenjunlia tyrosinilytica TaxID=1544741 RepID=A0A917ZQT4_9ACTN|nr:type II toxin-antitoxin system PemK/MazF family toxin [Wenjunlia tyrosinilytica]GGO87649.1 hypothetical protein GCM10012280_26590 [Wenjunlia tyrosinilytica]
MGGWWWLAAVVVVIAFVAAVSDGTLRQGSRRRGAAGGRPPGRPSGGPRPPRAPKRPTGRPSGKPSGGKPRAGEIWWADVPFEDGPGSKDRPCLVVSVNGGSAVVAKITSQDRSGSPGAVELPAGSVGDSKGRRSWLETDELRELRLSAFRRRVGPVPASLWKKPGGR